VSEGKTIPATEKPRRRRSRVLGAAGAVAVLILGVAGYALHIQPGVQIRDRDLRACRGNLGMIAAALLRHAQQHEGNFPARLGVLREEGFLPQTPHTFSCPLTGEYGYRGGLRWDMPLGTHVCWEDAAPHRYTYPKSKSTILLIHTLDGSLGVNHYGQRVAEGDEERTFESLRGTLRQRLAQQKKALAMARSADAGRDGAWAGIRSALRNPRQSTRAAFAAYAVGRSGRRDLSELLLPLLRTGGVREPAYSAALALARLDRREGVEVLIQGLTHDAYLVRRNCSVALADLFGETHGYAAYLPKDAREAAAQRWRIWWKENRP
jgi:hypothetical protein